MKITKFLPEEKPMFLLQAKVDVSLWSKVNDARKKMDLSWSELVTAMFKAFLEEVK